MQAFCLASVLYLNYTVRIVLYFLCYYLKSKNSSSHKIQIWVLKFRYTFSVYTMWNILLNLEYMEFQNLEYLHWLKPVHFPWPFICSEIRRLHMNTGRALRTGSFLLLFSDSHEPLSFNVSHLQRVIRKDPDGYFGETLHFSISLKGLLNNTERWVNR